MTFFKFLSKLFILYTSRSKWNNKTKSQLLQSNFILGKLKTYSPEGNSPCLFLYCYVLAF